MLSLDIDEVVEEVLGEDVDIERVAAYFGLEDNAALLRAFLLRNGYDTCPMCGAWADVDEIYTDDGAVLGCPRCRP